MTLLTLLLFTIPAVLGTTVLASLNAVREKVTAMLIGTIGGLAVATILIYGLALVLPPTGVLLLGVLALLTGVVIGLLLATNAWDNFKRASLDRSAVVVFLILLALFAIIAPKLLIEKDGVLSTGIINAYGDVAWHVANITTFAAGQPFPPENPIFAGTRLVYPFLTNVFSAALVVGGASIATSVTLPALILIPLALTLLYLLIRNIARGSRAAATIALLLFLFGGATLGWARFGTWWQESDVPLWQFLTHLPNQDFSGVGTEPLGGFHFLNPVTTLLLPQRSFLFGLPLGLGILILLTQRVSRSSYATAGVLAGLLPLFHAHTALAIAPAVITPLLINRTRHWLTFFVPALLLGLPEAAYHLLGIQDGQSFFRWAPGWMAGDTNMLWYWFKNTGLILPATAATLFFKTPRIIKALASAGLIIFATANLFLFAPWAWDNYKLFVWWFILSLPAVAWLATQAMRIHWITRSVVILLIAIHVASAALDIWKLILPTASQWVEWDAASAAFTQEIQQVTQPGDVILTAPIHNSPVVLAGRIHYLGYPAHVWSHGGDPWEREVAVQQFYEGAIDALPDLQPDYVLIGPAERSAYPHLTIHPNWQEITRTEQYTLYKPLE